MRIAIIGAGAMGCLFAGLLVRKGHNVLLADHDRGKLAWIEQHGVRIDETDESFTVYPQVVYDPACSQHADLVILLVKTTATQAAMRLFAALAGEHALVLTLQNGLGNADDLAAFVSPEQIVVGTTLQGSTLLSHGHVRHTGCGRTVIGWHRLQSDTRLAEIANLFRAAGIDTAVTDNILPAIWEKVLINAGINALTALLDVPNGELLGSAETLAAMRSLVAEAVAVAAAQGCDFYVDQAMERCRQAAQATAANLSSMLQDIRRGRSTEIARINGAIADLGEKHGVPVPCSRQITQLIISLEQLKSHQDPDQP